MAQAQGGFADVLWDLHFQVKLGETNGRFLEGLRRGVLRGTKCGACGWVFVPAQSYCERCLAPADEWRDLPSTGAVQTFTVVHIAPGGGPKTPFVLGAIRIDGADGLLLHLIGDVAIADDGSAEALVAGDRVEAVWETERRGHIFDIRHFVPAGRQSV